MKRFLTQNIDDEQSTVSFQPDYSGMEDVIGTTSQLSYVREQCRL